MPPRVGSTAFNSSPSFGMSFMATQVKGKTSCLSPLFACLTSRIHRILLVSTGAADPSTPHHSLRASSEPFLSTLPRSPSHTTTRARGFGHLRHLSSSTVDRSPESSPESPGKIYPKPYGHRNVTMVTNVSTQKGMDNAQAKHARHEGVRRRGKEDAKRGRGMSAMDCGPPRCGCE
eukprot:scaffold1052_cov339-Pavlova_lutheri.AAC.47